MMSATHKLVGGSTAFVAATAAGLPLELVSASVVVSAMASSIPDDVEKILRTSHRRLTHWPIVQIGFAFALGALATSLLPTQAALISLVFASLALGCVMHSCADAMTVDRHGIQLLWPISRRGYHLLPFSMRVWVGSKSTSERVFVVIWIGFVLIYAYAHFSQLISV